MNDIIRAMKERRSIRRFRSEMPSKEDIDSIIEAGLYAPSGMNRQSAIVIAVTDKEKRDELARDNCRVVGWPDGTDPFYGAPVILIVLADADASTAVYDGSLMMGNMLLAAHSLGLGSIWIHRAKEEFETTKYKNLLKELGIGGRWIGIGHCAVGYADCELPDPPKRKDGRVYYI
ncbi:MAG: nitroreductase [Clostridia bacterium]|nr:nitroreductase [Clostridia bacterium]